jgi:hypothetical protein
MPQGKYQVIGKIDSGPVPFIEDFPYTFFPLAAPDMFFRDTAWLANGGLKGQGLNERSPACEPGLVRNEVLLESMDGG